jgi:hypothetical protein
MGPTFRYLTKIIPWFILLRHPQMDFYVSLGTTRSMDVRYVYLCSTNSVICRMYLFTPQQAAWTRRMYLFAPQAEWDVRDVCIYFNPQQYRF